MANRIINRHYKNLLSTLKENSKESKFADGGKLSLSELELLNIDYNKFILNIPEVLYDEGGQFPIPKAPTTPEEWLLEVGISEVKQTVPTKLLIIDLAWAAENPNNRGLIALNLYGKYPDPNNKGYDVGPGLFVGKTIENKKEYTKEELDEAVAKLGIEGLNNIGKSYNETFRSPGRMSPWDEVPANVKLLMLDTRYLNGSLPQEKWPSLYLAVNDEDYAEALRQSRSFFVKDGKVQYDNDRVRRRADILFPGLFSVEFNNLTKPLPKVTPSNIFENLPQSIQIKAEGGNLKKWKNLSMKERGSIIRDYIKNEMLQGAPITSIDISTIKHKYDEGGYTLPEDN